MNHYKTKIDNKIFLTDSWNIGSSIMLPHFYCSSALVFAWLWRITNSTTESIIFLKLHLVLFHWGFESLMLQWVPTLEDAFPKKGAFIGLLFYNYLRIKSLYNGIPIEIQLLSEIKKSQPNENTLLSHPERPAERIDSFCSSYFNNNQQSCTGLLKPYDNDLFIVKCRRHLPGNCK